MEDERNKYIQKTIAFICSRCGKVCKSKSGLLKHLKTSYYCNIKKSK